MAEGIARKMLRGQASVESAGTKAIGGSPASDEAIEVMQKSYDIDISSHRSRNLRMKDARIDDFDYIIAMDDTVAAHLRSVYPSINSKLIPWDVPGTLLAEAAHSLSISGDSGAVEERLREISRLKPRVIVGLPIKESEDQISTFSRCLSIATK